MDHGRPPSRWATTRLQQKFTVAVSAGAPPDLATIDMTWLPTFASNGLFADLGELSGGQLNGEPIENSYSPGALEAMKYNDTYITMMFDFDVYALYYRADLFQQKGIQVPKTWDEMQAAAKQLAEDTNGDGKCDKYCFEVVRQRHLPLVPVPVSGRRQHPERRQLGARLQQSRGAERVELLQVVPRRRLGHLLEHRLRATPCRGSRTAGSRCSRTVPYFMGLLKSGAPEEGATGRSRRRRTRSSPAATWAAPASRSRRTRPHPQEAWLFEQFMLQPAQQLGLFKFAGAAPATQQALASPALTKPDPYFGGEAPFPIFQDRRWRPPRTSPTWRRGTTIDTDIGNMVESVMLNKAHVSAGARPTAPPT